MQGLRSNEGEDFEKFLGIVEKRPKNSAVSFFVILLKEEIFH